MKRDCSDSFFGKNSSSAPLPFGKSHPSRRGLPTTPILNLLSSPSSVTRLHKLGLTSLLGWDFKVHFCALRESLMLLTTETVKYSNTKCECMLFWKQCARASGCVLKNQDNRSFSLITDLFGPLSAW